MTRLSRLLKYIAYHAAPRSPTAGGRDDETQARLILYPARRVKAQPKKKAKP